MTEFTTHLFETAEAAVAAMNERYCIVRSYPTGRRVQGMAMVRTIIGHKIEQYVGDPEPMQEGRWEVISKSTFRALLAPYRVRVGKRDVALSQFWFQHPAWREHERALPV
jgi:hypothetical protein